MAIYELRTYAAIVGKMAELTALYTNEGWPALAKHPQKLVGYFTGDVGADPEFMAFAAKIRPLIREQNNKLMLSAPWGPKP